MSMENPGYRHSTVNEEQLCMSSRMPRNNSTYGARRPLSNLDLERDMPTTTPTIRARTKETEVIFRVREAPFICTGQLSQIMLS